MPLILTRGLHTSTLWGRSGGGLMKIGIISDIHEDGIRLMQALTGLEKHNCDKLVCLGDIAGFDKRFYGFEYTRNLSYCLQAIRTSCSQVIAGNHDFFVMKKIPDWNHVFDYPENWYLLSPSVRNSLSKGLVWNFEHDLPVNISADDMEWLNSLEEYYILEENGLRILFTHSLFPDTAGMLTRKPVKHSDFEPHIGKLAEMNCDFGISGHFHPGGVFRIAKNKTKPAKFGLLDIGTKILQLVCPCVAEGSQDNGYAVLDTKERTIEVFPLRTPKQHIIW
jgi:predicted phosphodiesterase